MNFEEEMNRFEAEIKRNAGGPMIMPGGFPPMMAHNQFGLMSSHSVASFPGMVPHQVRPKVHSGPATISAAPAVVASTKLQSSSTISASAAPAQDEDDEDVFAKLAKYESEHKKEKKKKKKKSDKGATTTAPTAPLAATLSGTTVASLPNPSATATPVAMPTTSVPAPAPAPKPFNTVSAATSHTPISAKIGDEVVKKVKKQKKVVRTGGGQIWEDPSLKDWDPNDFRIFCGDLGNDVTDDVLARTFGRYPSFQKAKVIRDKRSNKTRGYGFVSFRDPSDFTRAMREINGKYVGSRPIKLRKSNWQERNIDVVRKKQKLKQQMGYKW